MTLPTVSIILPTHNRPDLLAQAIASLDRQSYPGPGEILIADDASSPPVTASSLPPCRFAVRIVRSPTPQGGAAAKNLGVQAACGDYLVFLDDDDLLSPGYIEDALAALQTYPNIKTLFMRVEWFGERAEWGQTHHDRNTFWILEQTKPTQIAPELFVFNEDLFFALLQRIPMPFQRPVLRREDFLAIGAYQKDCLLWDCEWALRAALYGPCALLQKSPYLQRASGQGYSSTASRQEEHLRAMLVVKERLLDHPKASSFRSKLTDSLAQGYFDLAYFYSENRRFGEALAALKISASYGRSLKQLKLLTKIGLKSWI
ncbi:hypothetical protein JCM13664_02820 [Methylothermus subterraneus]